MKFVFCVVGGSVCLLGHCICMCWFLGNCGWFTSDILPLSDGRHVFLCVPCTWDVYLGMRCVWLCMPVLGGHDHCAWNMYVSK